MGANGSRATHGREDGVWGRWREVEVLDDAARVIEMRNPGDSQKPPLESRAPGEVYVMPKKGGGGVKSISVYGGDRKKSYEIHFQNHKGMNPHYHLWKDGVPEDAIPMNAETEQMAERILSLM